MGARNGASCLLRPLSATAVIVEVLSVEGVTMRKHQGIIPAERIERRIFQLRAERVILSTDLAQLNEVEPRALIQAVKRNAEQFASDFMFQLSAQEFTNVKSQIVTPSWGGLRRAAPFAFTEQGVAMLSSVLRASGLFK